MKMLWCWRCKMEMPMLDEKQFAIVNGLYSQGIRATKEFRETYRIPLKDCPIEELFRPMREAYRKLTNFEETNHLAILHHRVLIYGKPCVNCGKPLRTPQANFCAACGKYKD